ncbi:MAG: DUF4190 domain-containing protein [Actinomycetota bacterium]|nr:DUF4190 domain-containing protein [Actinomycetota bacterium]
MATASLVLGLLWLGGVGSVAAVLCGHWGHRQIAVGWERGRVRATLGIRLGVAGHHGDRRGGRPERVHP